LREAFSKREEANHEELEVGLEALERLRLDSLKETALLGEEDSSGSRQIHAEGECKCRLFILIFTK
jgi:hypothetical protein